MVGLSLPFFKKKTEKSVVVTAEGEEVVVDPVPENAEILDEYWVREKYARVVIARAPESSTITYYVDEVKLNPDERAAYLKISDIIAREMNPAEIGKEEDVRKELLKEARRLSMKYERAFKTVTRAGWDKINYYLERDLLGFGPLNVIINDYRVEDLSCDGVNVPIFVWHRRYESIPTNIKFLDKDALDDYIVKLAHKSGKHVSSAFPIVDAMLFGKHRLAASFRDEVSPKGSTFTIRKFREEPFSIVDLVQMGTISDEMAAYFWMLIENRCTIMVIGGTGSGKTTILNALASLIKPGMKLVTVEETAELNLPHENWVQFVSRESYGLTGTKVGQISLFDLVKTSLRYRPDYLIVGEVRGEEAYVLFQAMATGHGGLSTLHAENIEYAIRRLVSPPMNVSETYIPLINAVILVERVTLPQPRMGMSIGRRARMVWEVEDFEKYVNIFSWVPQDDIFLSRARDSFVLMRIAERLGKSRRWIVNELERRKIVIRWMADKGIHNVKDVARIVYQYYSNPDLLMSKIEEEAVIKKEEIQPIFTSPTLPTAATVTPTPTAAETQAPVRMIEESLMKIYSILSSKGGTASLEVLAKESGMDDVSLWRYLNILKGFGHVQTVEKKEEDKYTTFFTLTERGVSAFETLRSRLSQR
ncbi:MAG: type II/IV secretion system ATPase subunit [Nitrososphaeria archaeon]|nr:type II/IV secretion system ATPase subunit [Nitrososphaeria archaeon]